jgi:hypothetical protein
MAKTKQIPHVEVMSRKYAANKALLLVECNISADAYNVHVYNQAIAWIRANIWNCDDMVDALTEQPMFWAWWINQWNMREDAYIHEYLEYIISGDDFSDILHHGWVGIHNVNAINVNIQQPEWLQDAYNNIISQTFKTLHK